MSQILDTAAEGAPSPEPVAHPHRQHSARAALVWAYVLTVGRFAISGGVVVFLATILSPRSFGVMALALVWIGLAQVLVQHGPTLAVIQRKDVTEDHFNAAFWVTLTGSVLFAVAFAATAPLWARANGTPDLKVLCWALTPAIVLNGLGAVPDAYLRRDMQFRRLSLRVLLSGMISGLAAAAAAVLGLGVWALAVQQLTLSLVSAVTVWAISPWRPRRRRFGRALADLRRFSLHSISEIFAFFVQARADALLLGLFFNPAAIGLYRLASRMTDTVTDVAAGGLGQVSLPHLSRFSTDRQAFAAWLGKIVHAAAVLALPSFAVLAAASPYLLPLLGPQWRPAVVPLQVLCFDAAFGVLGSVMSPAIQAAGRPGFTARAAWIQAVVMAVVVVAVGVRYAHASVAREVLAMAITFLIVRLVFLAAVAVAAFAFVFKVRMGPVLRPSLPAVSSAVAAAAVGMSLRPALQGLPLFVALVVVSAVAAGTAGAILLVADREVRTMACRVMSRATGLFARSAVT